MPTLSITAQQLTTISDQDLQALADSLLSRLALDSESRTDSPAVLHTNLLVRNEKVTGLSGQPIQHELKSPEELKASAKEVADRLIPLLQERFEQSGKMFMLKIEPLPTSSALPYETVGITVTGQGHGTQDRPQETLLNSMPFIKQNAGTRHIDKLDQNRLAPSAPRRPQPKRVNPHVNIDTPEARFAALPMATQEHIQQLAMTYWNVAKSGYFAGENNLGGTLRALQDACLEASGATGDRATMLYLMADPHLLETELNRPESASMLTPKARTILRQAAEYCTISITAAKLDPGTHGAQKGR